LLAYWEIAHSAEPRRAMMSAPLTWHDSVTMELMKLGKNPADFTVDKPTARNRRPKRLERVSVVGGAWTPAFERAAQQAAKSATPREWATKTGSNADAIAWATKSD
jgi:hypothetical protein